LPEFQEKALFNHSLMTCFRKRWGANIINELNEWIVLEEQKRQVEEENNNDDDHHDDTDDVDDHGSDDHQPSGLLRKRLQLNRFLPERRTKENSFWTQPVHRLILLTLQTLGC
jgi:ABC-type Zn2+ transport system substrate-binding protein/surface adhesin